MSLALQNSLDLRDRAGQRLTFIRPMLGVESIRALTGLSEDEILAEIQSGKIRWAFNLSGAKRQTVAPRRPSDSALRTPHSESHRCYLRVWNRSIICYVNPSLPQPADLAVALTFILPHSRPALRCTELMRSFNVSSQHILNLVDDGLLAKAPSASSPPNSRTSPIVTRNSVISFLESRRLHD
jgi:hypothetical protein